MDKNSSHPIYIEQPIYVSKVLDVRPGKISYIVGTLFMDMPMKPNILDDITKEVPINPLGFDF